MEQLKKDEVSLRVFNPEDKFRMAELANNEKISINLRDEFPYPYTVDDAERFIDVCIHQIPPSAFAIEFNGIYVGNIGLRKGEDIYRKSAEIGYFLGEPYWNKGIMTKAVNLICEYGFKELDIVRIFTGVFEYNIASRKVLEKCGFEREAIFKKAVVKNGKIYDEVRFGKIK